MNNQQARIEALLEEAATFAEDAREVDLVIQTELLSEGYHLGRLNRDLRRIRNS